MTIVSNSTSPTMCNNDGESACSSCRKLQDEIKTTVTQMAGKIDSLVTRVEEIYRQQQLLKSQVNGRRMSCTSSTSEEVPASNNLADMLSSLLGDATPNADGTATLNGVRLEPGVTVSFDNNDQQFKIESPISNSNGSRKRKPARSAVQRVPSEMDINTSEQQIDTNALALAFGLNTNNIDASMTKTALDFLSNMSQQVDLSSLATLNTSQPKRKIQRKSGKSSPNHQPISNSQGVTLNFGNKTDELKLDSQQNANELATANFLSSILGNTLSTPQQSNGDSANYWNENVPLKSDEVSVI
jgi:hypothetical protein